MPLRKTKKSLNNGSTQCFFFFFYSLADMCIAIAISLLMILICAMATYGAYKVSRFEISWAFNRFRQEHLVWEGTLTMLL